MSIEPAQAPAARFTVQLLQAYVYEVHVTRRERREGDADEPSLNAGPRTFNHSESDRRLVVLLAGQIAFPFSDGLNAVAEIDCSVFGTFSYDGQPTEEQLRAFPQREGTVILWPYLRACVAQIAGMTGLQLPPVPTLDVLAFTGRESARGDAHS